MAVSATERASRQLLLDVLRCAKDEEVIKTSSLGPVILEAIDQLLKSDISSFANSVTCEVESLLSKSDTCASSTSQVNLWKDFHAVRLSKNLKDEWMAIINSLYITLPAKSCDVLLQIILTRTLHHSIPQKIGPTVGAAKNSDSISLTAREENAIRYILL